MYLTAVRHRVRDFTLWRKAFDHNAGLLFDTFGCVRTHIVKVNNDPTDIAIINIWKSKKHWEDFGMAHGSEEYKGRLKTKEDGTVVGEVVVWEGEVVEGV